MIKCNLAEYLEEAGMNISDFCKEIDISRTYYYELIKGEKMPTIKLCYSIKFILQDELDRDIPIEKIWEYKFY